MIYERETSHSGGISWQYTVDIWERLIQGCLCNFRCNIACLIVDLAFQTFNCLRRDHCRIVGGRWPFTLNWWHNRFVCPDSFSFSKWLLVVLSLLVRGGLAPSPGFKAGSVTVFVSWMSSESGHSFLIYNVDFEKSVTPALPRLPSVSSPVIVLPWTSWILICFHFVPTFTWQMIS